MEYKKLDNVFVVGLCGRSGSGKSYFANEIVKRFQYYASISNKDVCVTKMSLATYVKNIATFVFGWDGLKDKRGRALLIGIGNDVGRKYNEDIWIDELCQKIYELSNIHKNNIIIIDDIRYYNETQICDMLIKIDIPFYKKIRQFFEIWRWSKSERGLWLRKIRPRIKTISTVNNKKEDYTKFITEWLVMQINNERFERREDD